MRQRGQQGAAIVTTCAACTPLPCPARLPPPLIARAARPLDLQRERGGEHVDRGLIRAQTLMLVDLGPEGERCLGLKSGRGLPAMC